MKILKGVWRSISGLVGIVRSMWGELFLCYFILYFCINFIPKCFLMAYDSVNNTHKTVSYLAFLDRTSLVGILSILIVGAILFSAIVDMIKKAPENRRMKNNQDLISGAEEGDLEKVKKALSKGADIHFNDDQQYSWSALTYASCHGHLEVAKYLVEQGANIHAKDDFALTIASQYGNQEMVDYLVSVGCDPQKIEAEQFYEAT